MHARHWLFAALMMTTGAHAKEHDGKGKPKTLEQAISSAENALDNGRLGDAFDVEDKLKRTHGLHKDEQARVDVIVARCALLHGQYASAAAILAKRSKAQPDDTRLAEWYGRALEGAGKDDQALSVLSPLAQKDALQEGDSYWSLAQLEHKKGEDSAARTHAKQALEKPIVLQSQQLEDDIHKFIDQLSTKQK